MAQLAGVCGAGLLLRGAFGLRGDVGLTRPGAGFTSAQPFLVEVVLTLGLVSTVLGTASAAQNLGALSAFGVSGYILVAGLWASPISGASMNPTRSAEPAVAAGDLHALWIYLSAPTLGMLLAVAAAWLLRGPGGGIIGSRAAQGSLHPPVLRRRSPLLLDELVWTAQIPSQ